MTPIDLKIKFKFDTGHYPVYDNYKNNKLKTTYGLWLEDKLGNRDKLRFVYLKNNGIHPIYERWKRSQAEVLKQEYILWLEDRFRDK